MFDRNKLISNLERDEAYRAVVYDDANGKPIVPGTTVIGHPTTGIGWALDVTPLTHDRAQIICGWEVDDKAKELFQVLPWAGTLDEVRCRALMNMVFNLGLAGLLGFHNTLTAIQGSHWADAAAGIRASKWYHQVGARAERIARAFETGVD